MALTRVAASGISTVGTFALQNINTSGIVTATGGFVGDVTGDLSGNVSGTAVTATTANFTNATISGDLTVQGTTTTLDTTLTEVDKLEVGANNTTVGVAITQSGTGDILRLYDGASQVVTVADGGNVGIGTNNPSDKLHVYSSGANTISTIDSVSGDAGLQLRNSGNGNWSGINFIRERSTGTNVAGGSIWMPSDTSNNGATLYLQTQSASANAGQSGALTDNNGVRLKLASQPNGVSADTAFSVEVGSQERLRVTSSGNVGIGTDNPTKKLTVYGSDAELVRLTQAVDSGTQQEFGIGFAANLNHTHPAAQITYEEFDASDSRGNLLFYTRGDNSDSAPAERLRIASNGKVGINTNDPKQFLHVAGRTTFDVRGDYYGAWIDGDSDGTSSFNVGAWHNVGGRLRNNGNHVAVETMNTAHHLQLQPNGGNVGIGLSHPDAKLHIYQSDSTGYSTISDQRSEAEIRITNPLETSGTFSSINFYNGGGTGGDISLNAVKAGNYLSHFTIKQRAGGGSTDWRERLRITSSGDIGIGNTAPTEKLHIEGGKIRHRGPTTLTNLGPGNCVSFPCSRSITTNTTKTFTFTGLQSGWLTIRGGGYSSAGQSQFSFMYQLGGYMTATHTYDVHTVRQWGSGVTISTTKNAQSFVISITNNSSTYSLSCNLYVESSSPVNVSSN